jgi:pseudouridine-5'-phosphate glycosidase
MTRARVHDQVSDAIAAGRPVVALESAVICAGLPRAPVDPAVAAELPGWDPAGPANLELARLLVRAVSEGGAVPAVVAVIDGAVRIGLTDDELAAIAADTGATKVSVADLPWAVSTGATAGTTVSATLAACGLPDAGPIRVFATGGIGGVHRGWAQRPDVSADLAQLGRTSCCVVCSGPKSVLDGAATLEVLETIGVTVLGYRTDVMPAFYSRGSANVPAPRRVDDTRAAADACRARWHGLACPGAVLVAQPVPERAAVGHDEIEVVLGAALADAEAQGVAGRDLTPFLLERLVRETVGRSLRANLALLHENARLAAAIAAELAGSPNPA